MLPSTLSNPRHSWDALHSRESEPAFYSLLLQQTEEILPIVYTPTVGEACQRYHRLPLTPVGLHLRATDPCFLTKLQAWPHQNVRSGTCRATLLLWHTCAACATALRKSVLRHHALCLPHSAAS